MTPNISDHIQANLEKNTTTITAKYQIVTPMFIGDASQQANGITVNSFKGALRFWWRALAWGRIWDNAGDDVKALKDLHKEEALLFGSSAINLQTKKIYGKGKVSIKILPQLFNKKDQNTIDPSLKDYTAARYLGYGVIEAFSSRVRDVQAGQLIRDCIDEGQSFTVQISCENSTITVILPALQALGLLGGLGSKNRKGYGSLALQSLRVGDENRYSPPNSIEKYYQQIAELLSCVGTLPACLPPFSVFSQHTLIRHLVIGAKCYDVLNAYGAAMLRYRSWGKDNQVLGEPSEKKFRKDHAWSKGQAFFNLAVPFLKYASFHPDRVVFGLPHNYGNNTSQQVSRPVIKNRKTVPGGRRASPLFFHVHPIGESFHGVACLLQATFLPKGEKIQAGLHRVEQAIRWKILRERFLCDSKRFPGSTNIFP